MSVSCTVGNNPVLGRAASNQRSILFLSSGQPVSQTRKWVLERVGYSVTVVQTTGAALSALKRLRIDLVLIGVVNKSMDVKQVTAAVRRQARRIPVLTVTQTPDIDADLRIGALAGPEALLRAVGEAIVAAHGHASDENDCVMFVDRQRRYFHVTDAAAELVGYKREELLGRKIDDISAPDMDVAGKFKAYVRNGIQRGVFHLRHRTGQVVPVRYAAKVLDDGCMMSRLRKVSA